MGRTALALVAMLWACGGGDKAPPAAGSGTGTAGAGSGTTAHVPPPPLLTPTPGKDFALPSGLEHRTEPFRAIGALRSGRLTVPLAGKWSLEGGPNGTQIARPEGIANAMVTLTKSAARQGRAVAELVPVALAHQFKTGELLKRNPDPPAVSTNPAGIEVALQVGAGRIRGKTYLVSVFGFAVGDEVQLLLATATDEATLKQLGALVEPGIAAATLDAPAPDPGGALASGATGAPAGGATSTFSSPDGVHRTWGRFQPDSPKLPEVPFAIVYTRPTAKFGIGISADLTYGRSKDGTLYVNDPRKYGLGGSAYGDHVVRVRGDDPKGEESGISLRSAAAALGAQLGTSVKSMYLFSLGVSADRLLVGVQLYHYKSEAFVIAPTSGSPIEVVAPPELVYQLANKREFDVTTTAREAPDGAVWIFVLDDYNDTLRMARMTRDASGWKGRAWTLAFDPAHPTVASRRVLAGNFDADGNWVFYSNDTLWHVTADGGTRPVATLAISGKGVWIPAPLVLPNGDIWLAVNTEIEVTGTVDPSTGFNDVTSTTLSVGDRARWIRFRADGKGGYAAAEISREALAKGLAKVGVSRQHENLLDSGPLRYDPATGGILSYDQNNGVIFVVDPED